MIRSSQALQRAWGAAIEQLRAHIASMRDVDPCAEISLVQEDDHVLVVARLADGRAAVRRAATPLAALATAEALLTVLPDNDVNAPAPPSPVPETPLLPPPLPERERGPKRVLTLDIGVGASSRVTVHPAFVGYGVTGYVSVGINQWILGSWLRWDVQDRPISVDVPSRFSASSFLLGAFTGRRFGVGRAALDVLVGPNLVVDNEEAGSGLEGDEVGGDMGGLSLGTSLRLLVPRNGHPGFFGLLSAEVYPRRLDHRVRADDSLPALSPWAFTLALGASWSAL